MNLRPDSSQLLRGFGCEPVRYHVIPQRDQGVLMSLISPNSGQQAAYRAQLIVDRPRALKLAPLVITGCGLGQEARQ